MSTPSIQTLRTDAQQVLNLDSISAVRSVVAATLANANAGTPLNPNLTTQQLWNEFYQIITQPKSDIESIIANQLMKFLYAPPAPGGVGANGQVIFNDGGVLAGDPQFLWNKTTNLLTVTGSATISGDLTVASSILKVTGGNVGINTATPTNTAGYKTLEIVGTGVNTGGMIRMKSSDASVSSYDFVDNNGRGIFAVSNHNLRFGCNDIEQYRIQPLGIFTWYDGAGGTRMTLNSTGLGVGVTPNRNLDVRQDQSAATIVRVQNQSVNAAAYSELNLSASGNNWGIRSGSTAANSNRLEFVVDPSGTNLSVMRLDTSGNVGVGVTPKSWLSSYKAIQIGYSTSLSSTTGTDFAGLSSNAYVDSVDSRWERIVSGYATQYYQNAGDGQHIWRIAGTAAADTAITWTNAMTLDASGNLLVGTTSAFNSARVSISGAGGSGGIVTAIQNDNDTYFAINFRNSGGTSCGSISCTTSATAFNLSSDYRLKESVQPLTGGLTRINALKPSIYKWKVDGKSGEGFIAHELADVVPLAVTGEKDAVNEDGSIKPQQVDFSKIVPILVAAIQELTAEVNALKNA
jgi:hypothetical protein